MLGVRLEVLFKRSRQVALKDVHFCPMCNVRVAGGGHPPRLPQNVACGFADLPHYALQALVYSTA